jgi:sigma-B regulation protein RsbU (phosphoserine phosphatase)
MPGDPAGDAGPMMSDEAQAEPCSPLPGGGRPRWVETSRDVVFTLARDGTVTSLNPAFKKITGWSVFWSVGREFDRLVHPEDLPYARMCLRRVMKGETLAPFQLRIRARSGKVLVGEFAVTGIVRNGQTMGVMGVARDVTRRLLGAKELEAVHEELMAVLRRLQDMDKQDPSRR